MDFTMQQVPVGYVIIDWIDHVQGVNENYEKAISEMLNKAQNMHANYVVQVAFQEAPGRKVASGWAVIVQRV